MNIGHYRTKFPRNYGVPKRGWDPQNPTTLTVSLQLPEDDTQIWEGQILTPNADGTKWVLGAAQGTTPTIVAFAQNSTLSTDVVSANNLVGLSCSGKFRLATPFFCRSVPTSKTNLGSTTITEYSVASYTPGTLLTYCKNNEIDFVSTVQKDGSVSQVQRSAAGFVRPAYEDEPVIGVVVMDTPDTPVSAIGTLNYNVPVSVTHEKTGALSADTTKYFMPGEGVVALSHTWEDAIDTSAELNNSYYIVLDTTFAPTK